DPAADRTKARMMPTMSALFDRYEREHMTTKTPESRDACKHALKHARRLYGRVQVDEIDSSHIVLGIDRIRDRPGVAFNMVAYTSAAWNWGRLRKLVPANRLNPTVGVPVPKGMSRKQDISDEEYARIGAALDRMMSGSKVDLARILAVKMCLFSGCRPVVAMRMSHEDVRADRGVIVLDRHKTAEKTGRPKLIFITPEIEQVLADAEKLREVRNDHRYIF